MKRFLIVTIKKHRSFIAFAIIGGVNTLVDFLVFTAFYELSGLPIDICHAFGYCAGIISSFILNRNFTFRNTGKKSGAKPVLEQIIRFLAVNGISGITGMVLIKWLYRMGVYEYLAKALVTGVTMILNYVGYKLFVFSGRKSRS